MNRHILLLLLLQLAVICRADRDTTPGWLTDMLNQSLERAVGRKGDSAPPDSLCYGRNETRFASVPKFGGYLVGQYQYFSQAGAHGGPGFSARYIRAYVSGTLLRDFSYYVQMELKGKPGLRDYTISWQRWPELRVTLGQTDRFFTFESPMSLWKVGGWDYSQMVNNLNGAGDYCGEPNMNARDQGLILQGDVLPLGAKGLRRLRYTAAVYNGNGINQGDNNRRKDLVGNLQVQLAEDLWLGIFGWKGEVHYKAAPCLNAWLSTLDPNTPNNDIFLLLRDKINEEIHRNYKLFPSNYIAAEMLRQLGVRNEEIDYDPATAEFTAHYTPSQCAEFEKYLSQRIALVDLNNPDTDYLRREILLMYANPLYNYYKATGEK